MIHPFYILLLICILWICLCLTGLVWLSWKRNGMLDNRETIRRYKRALSLAIYYINSDNMAEIAEAECEKILRGEK
jgi:membrane carboxypeptidase/penicillin-binding protein